jgi:hypothetical protein
MRKNMVFRPDIVRTSEKTKGRLITRGRKKQVVCLGIGMYISGRSPWEKMDGSDHWMDLTIIFCNKSLTQTNPLNDWLGFYITTTHQLQPHPLFGPLNTCAYYLSHPIYSLNINYFPNAHPMNMKKWRVEIKGRNYVKHTHLGQSKDTIFFWGPFYLYNFRGPNLNFYTIVSE